MSNYLTTPKKVTVIEQLISDVHSYNINHHTRELYLHPYLDSVELCGLDYRMCVSFIKNLHILDEQNNKNILIHMQTEGGYWGDGMAVLNAIKFIKSSTTILAYAQASSMSGVLLQVADKRVMMPDCELMIHYGSISLEETSLAARSAIIQNERESKRMLELFAKRAINGKYFKDRNYGIRKTMSFIDSKLKQASDWYLNAEEAVYYGFADGVLGEKGFETISKIRRVKKNNSKL